MTKHFLKKRNHGSERVSHPVVVLLEGNDEHIYILDFLLEGCYQFLNSFLLLHQLIPKARCVNDSDPPLVPVSKPVSLISSCILSDAVHKSSTHMEATIFKLLPFIVLFPPKQDIGQARLSYPSTSKD